MRVGVRERGVGVRGGEEGHQAAVTMPVPQIDLMYVAGLLFRAGTLPEVWAGARSPQADTPAAMHLTTVAAFQ